MGGVDGAGVGVADGELLIEFAEAAVKGDPLDDARRRLVGRLGPEGAAQAAATVAAFSGLVRVADGTGIPIDDGLAAASADIRKDLDLGAFSGAANSSVDTVGAQPFATVEALWAK